jgi:hypothetical protein
MNQRPKKSARGRHRRFSLVRKNPPGGATVDFFSSEKIRQGAPPTIFLSSEKIRQGATVVFLG